MNRCDLFDEPLPPPEPEQVVELPLPPIAAPCSFRKRSNKAFQRFGRDPIRLDGRKLRSHGRLLFHYPMECFNGTLAEETPIFAEAAE
jgi:hypothetical protein